MKVKIDPIELFKQGSDLRKYLSISYSDAETSDFLENYDVDEFGLEAIIENYLYISLDIENLPDEIEVDVNPVEPMVTRKSWTDAKERMLILERLAKLNRERTAILERMANSNFETIDLLTKELLGEE